MLGRCGSPVTRSRSHCSSRGSPTRGTTVRSWRIGSSGSRGRDHTEASSPRQPPNRGDCATAAMGSLTCDTKVRNLPHDPPPHTEGRFMKTLIALGCGLLLAACDTGRPDSPARDGGVQAARSGGGGSFAFVNFELGAAPGTVCPGAAGCTNGAAEPMIRADATGTFYVSSELGVGSGTLAWRSSDGGLHYTALDSPNQLS